jgi:hypothetical protein
MAVLVKRGSAVPETVSPHASGVEEAAASAPQAVALPDMVFSVPIGPVEAAPPKARELWIECNSIHPKVGELMVGRAYYYGGYQGASFASWIGVNDQGEIVEVKKPTEVPVKPFEYLPDVSSDDHPCALRLTNEMKGWLVKFRLQPVRLDGDQGHLESSRPTKEIEM